MKTKDKILHRALEMFNEKGIEYVGIRELSEDLKIRPGNLTYYFATKDELVNELSVQLNHDNTGILKCVKDMSVEDFMVQIDRIFKNHQKYRCLLLSFVHLMDRNKWIQERYLITKEKRSDTLKQIMERLFELEYLKKNCTKEERHYLVSVLGLVIRFWISEAHIKMRGETDLEQRISYERLIGQILAPYLSKKGHDSFKHFEKSYLKGRQKGRQITGVTE